MVFESLISILGNSNSISGPETSNGALIIGALITGTIIGSFSFTVDSLMVTVMLVTMGC